MSGVTWSVGLGVTHSLLQLSPRELGCTLRAHQLFLCPSRVLLCSALGQSSLITPGVLGLR